MPPKRLALILASNNTVLEPLSTHILLPLLSTSQISIHYTRIPPPILSSSPSSSSSSSVSTPTHDPLESAVHLLSSLHPSAIIYAGTPGLHTSSLQTEAALSSSLSTNIPFSTCTLAIFAALDTLKVTKIGIVSPYPAGVTGKISDFFTRSGVEVVCITRLSQPTNDEVEIAEIEAEEVEDMAFSCAGHEGVEAVLVVGTNFRGAEGVERCERMTGKMVLDSALLTVWWGLRLAGFREGVRGWGRLMGMGYTQTRRMSGRSKANVGAKVAKGHESREGKIDEEEKDGLGDIVDWAVEKKKRSKGGRTSIGVAE